MALAKWLGHMSVWHVGATRSARRRATRGTSARYARRVGALRAACRRATRSTSARYARTAVRELRPHAMRARVVTRHCWLQCFAAVAADWRLLTKNKFERLWL